MWGGERTILTMWPAAGARNRERLLDRRDARPELSPAEVIAQLDASDLKSACFTGVTQTMRQTLTAIIAAACLVASTAPIAAPQPCICRAGAAEVDITPDYKSGLLPMCGYGARHKKPAQGVHDRLKAQAIVLTDGTNRLAIVSADLCWVSAALRQQVCKLAREVGFGPGEIMLAATATHSGPAGLDSNLAIQQAFGRYDPEVTAETARRIVQAIREAHASAQPASCWVAQQKVEDLVMRAADSKPVSARLSVMAFKTDEQWSAVLVSLPARGDILPAENMLLSADWPGFMREALRQLTGASVTSFVIGASASLVPRIGPDEENFEGAKAFGEKVARRAAALLDRCRRIQPFGVAVKTEPWKLPPAVPPPGVKLPVPLPVARAILPHQTTLQVARVGDTALIAVPGSMSASLVDEMDAKVRAAGAAQVVALGACNDYVGYFLSPEDYRADNRDVRFCLFGRDAGQKLAARLADLAASLFR